MKKVGESLPDNLQEIDAYLQREESNFPEITAETEKKVFWHGGDIKKTPYSFVYLHGYSATRQEIVPVCERLAEKVGANLYCTRLAGHGASPEFLAKATVLDWQRDTLEAYRLGSLLGEKVIVIGNSTGSTLATWLAMQKKYSVFAYIMLSPNFALKDKRAYLFKYPLLYPLLHVIVGRERKVEIDNEEHGRYWTTTYKLPSLAELLKLMRLVQGGDKESITCPLYLAYCPQDLILNTEAMDRFFLKCKAKIKHKVIFPESGDLQKHVIAGNILSSMNNKRLIDSIYNFLTIRCKI